MGRLDHVHVHVPDPPEAARLDLDLCRAFDLVGPWGNQR